MSLETSLDTFAGGRLRELLLDALDRVMQNIDDPSTELEPPREITMKIRVKPISREQVVVNVKCNASKLAGAKPIGTTLWIARQGASMTFEEYDPRQMTLPMPDAN